MLKARPSRPKDNPRIKEILEELGLSYPSQTLDDFWVAEKNEKIVGLVQLKDHKTFFFLSSLGVSTSEQKQGIASFLVKEALKSAAKDVYLYTIQPEFFKRLGFKVVPPPPFLPAKSSFECRSCVPEKCVCMGISVNAR